MSTTRSAPISRLVLGALLLLMALPPARLGAAVAPPGSAFAPIAAVVERDLAAGRVPGAVVLVGRGGQVVYHAAFGDRARQPDREAMTETTLFDLASLTKVVATTTAIMQLVDAGRLDLDAPAARYWPPFGSADKDAITVRQLLTHYSGLPAGLDAVRPGARPGDVLAAAVALRPRASAGTRFLYSDVNFVVLGEVVHRVAGEPLDTYCARHIFAPLGMRDTGFTPAPSRQADAAPTVRADGAWLRGTVHDPLARYLGGVAGNAGLFSTAADLARFAQMLLDGGRAGDVRILSAASVAAMTTPQSPAGGAARRGLGWDLEAPGVASWSALFSPRAYGHTGYTGTSLWIDPDRDAYVVLLTNRVHPDDRGNVRPLRADLAAAVVPLLDAASTATRGGRLAVAYAPNGADGAADPPAEPPAVQTGLEVLAHEGFAALAGRRVGLITNATARDAGGRRTIDVLRSAPAVTLAAIFTPEHGLEGRAEGPVGGDREPASGVPVYSLYGDVRRPTAAMLSGLDALVFDVQDVGARFYTYATTMAYAMIEARRHGLPFYVLDRPNPIDAAVVQGPLLDPALRSFTGYFPLPVRHGMTIGELAALFNRESGIDADLHVVRMHGYARGRWYDETGLPWVAPSPNLPSLTAATLYPGVGLVEGANVSVGRGTPSPFEVVGAPWIDASALAAYLERRAIPGVRFELADFVPARDRYASRPCHGVRVVLLDRERLDAPALGVELASALHRLHPGTFRLDDTLGMFGARWVTQAIARGEDPRRIVARWQPALTDFLALRDRFLLY